MEYAIGAGMALATGIFGTVTRFDRERTYYCVILVVVASYYLLFAAIGGSASAFASEMAGLIVFGAVAVIGHRTSLWIVAAMLAGHGLFDAVHGHVIDNPSVPVWWPGFCGTFDIVAGGYLAWRLSPLSVGERLAAR